MTTPPAPRPQQPDGPGPDDESTAAERVILRTALRDMLVLVGGLLVLGCAVGALVDGMAGVWGALVGATLAAFFCATTIWSMMRTIGANPVKMFALIMGTWMAKIVVLVVVLALLKQADFYNAYVLVAVLALGVAGSALLDYRAVKNTRMPYVQP
ncbi:hypothetical protein [Isoptericola aurantiacus]|uniref:hypothetical protein n=1 Tax=Isoptericola aurantiacus TaxID=3377839 RepID=UPI003839F647